MKIGSGSTSNNFAGAIWSGVQITINQGSSIEHVPFGVSVSSLTADAGPDQLLNCSQSTAILQGSASSGSPTWQAYNGGNILSGANSFSPEVDAAGLYVLSVSDGNNTATDTALVSFDPCIIPYFSRILQERAPT